MSTCALYVGFILIIFSSLSSVGMFDENGFFEKHLLSGVTYGSCTSLVPTDDVKAAVDSYHFKHLVDVYSGTSSILDLDPSSSSLKDRSLASNALHECMERNLNQIFPQKQRNEMSKKIATMNPIFQ